MDGFCHKMSVCFCSIIQPVDVMCLFRVYIKWVMMIKQIFDCQHFLTCYGQFECTENWSLETNLIYLSFVKTENSERPAAFEGRGNMGEELDSLRATVDEQHIYENNNSTSHRRRKRFLSYPRYVELMVTADAKMVRHHGRNLEHYILTIMSVVSKIMFLKLFIVQVSDKHHPSSVKMFPHYGFLFGMLVC